MAFKQNRAHMDPYGPQGPYGPIRALWAHMGPNPDWARVLRLREGRREREGGGKRGKAASIPHFLMPLRTTVLYNVHSRQPRRPEPLLCWCCSRGTHAYHGEGGRQPAGAIATRALRPRLSGGGRSGVFWLPLNCPRRVKRRFITSTHLVRLRVMPVDTACHNPRKTGYIWCEQAACIQSFFVLSHRLCGG